MSCCKEEKIKMPKPKPQMTIYSDDLPELKDFRVDGNYVLRVRVNIKKLGQGDEYSDFGMDKKDAKRLFARCEITSVELDNKKDEPDTIESFNKKKGQALTK